MPTTKTSPRLLIVEDDVNDLRLLKRTLDGFAVTHASSVDDAVAICARENFDVCLLDYNLDGKDGLQLFARLGALAAGLPIVVLTGHDDPLLERRAYQMGAADFLHKDMVDSGVIERVIQNVLRGGRPVGVAADEPAASLRVLVIDDEPLMLRAIKRTLAREHDVTICERAEDALALLDGGAAFDAIIADVRMPQMTGPEFLAVVVETHPTHAKRIGFLTSGAHTAPDLQTAQRPIIGKPFTNSELRTFIALLASMR